MVAGDLFCLVLFTAILLWAAYRGIVERQLIDNWRVYLPETRYEPVNKLLNIYADAWKIRGISALIFGLWALLIAVASVALIFIGSDSRSRIETPLGSIHPLEWMILATIGTALVLWIIIALRFALKLFQAMSHRTRNSSETH